MVTDITFIVLSPKPVKMTVPDCILHNQAQSFDKGQELEQLHTARLESVYGIDTKWCAYLDSDDNLLNTHLIGEMLDAANEAGTNLIYTDWMYNYKKSRYSDIAWTLELVGTL
jgi:hypothetical protein